MVLKIALDLDQQRPARQQRSDRMAVDTVSTLGGRCEAERSHPSHQCGPSLREIISDLMIALMSKIPD